MKDRLARAALEGAAALAAVLLALLAGSALILARGHDPLLVYRLLFTEALASGPGLSQVAFKTTTLAFTGLAAAFSFRSGLFNIGAEGQLYLGAFAAALAGLALGPGMPAAVAIPALVLAAAAGGVAAALVPALLKATRGTHEVIATMMMNFIVISLVNWGLTYSRERPDVVRTAPVPDTWRLLVFVRGFDGNAALLLAIAVALGTLYFFGRTRTGYELRAVGAGPRAAEAGGVSITRATVAALAASGGIAGLGGVNFVLGSPGYFEQSFAPFQGYLGIAVALLARNHPLGVVPAAALFAVMAEGSQAIQALEPRELGSILQAVVVVFVILAARALERFERARTARAGERRAPSQPQGPKGRAARCKRAEGRQAKLFRR